MAVSEHLSQAPAANRKQTRVHVSWLPFHGHSVRSYRATVPTPRLWTCGPQSFGVPPQGSLFANRELTISTASNPPRKGNQLTSTPLKHEARAPRRADSATVTLLQPTAPKQSLSPAGGRGSACLSASVWCDPPPPRLLMCRKRVTDRQEAGARQKPVHSRTAAPQPSHTRGHDWLLRAPPPPGPAPTPLL